MADMIRRKLTTRIRYLLWHSDLEATRLMLGLSAILWALFLAWSGDLFPTAAEVAAGRGRMTYAIMGQVMTENQWAALWLLQGSVMLWSLATGARNTVLMCVDAVLGVLLWSVCVASSFVVYWPSGDFLHAVMRYNPPAAMAGEVGMVLASWWVLVRYQRQLGEGRVGKSSK